MEKERNHLEIPNRFPL